MVSAGPEPACAKSAEPSADVDDGTEVFASLGNTDLQSEGSLPIVAYLDTFKNECASADNKAGAFRVVAKDKAAAIAAAIEQYAVPPHHRKRLLALRRAA
jgi:hypothetical protein